LFRRFDDLIEYDLPEKKEIIAANGSVFDKKMR
jgi:hypothetical protein